MIINMKKLILIHGDLNPQIGISLVQGSKQNVSNFETRVSLGKEKIMKVKFDITKIVFTPYCDNYDFTLGITRDDEGDECYLGIDIPCEYDAECRCWLLFEDDNVDWNISNEDKEYVKQEAIKYCLSNGYSYNGKYFEQR